ncbi:TetR family transcriptional regulator [Pseudonocardia sp. HH130629-09]|uniref:TetR family transcriptional regulator n=1 Tax=Pseudonocardia sp. HH130629-09 TaxID=1641402 RepID=UPI0006CB0CD3|nr:TetR family transcriptional regulator [Pseudonocardia sp. HH130629-09]ALE85872.1 TetR family transcriptional regulator [Pseudonocardia sp. HH130629-09]
MPPDATETKRRILAAARSEFAQCGLAGARIDRIADRASANKRSIYVHFGPKEELFDRVVAQGLVELAETVSFTPDDLPGYAGRLFDHLLVDPTILRLSTWANLERPDATAGEAEAYRAKVNALTHRYGDRAVDVLALVLGMVTAWATASPSLRTLAGDEPWSSTRLAEHRRVMTASVETLQVTCGDHPVEPPQTDTGHDL